ncbi:hypothetical protein AK830_g10324 [Neonectria ditissima]|uniref:Branched-chain-amino-acid aminotransferase-like protein 2 n=1 Tax=Neonectria ditissima TaxID=78410 RepID=A0A0P7ATJ6_9HYPO|nr:hypothetical protein AK830_g10324 [Neonectria ditissima]
MALRPIFAATHPRACSTAFERVFMTRRDILESIHEPFGDAFYFGPEFLSDRFRDDAATREASGYAQKTYKDILDSITEAGNEGKRIFIKDMAYYLMKADNKPTQIAPSLGEEEPTNPTVIPLEILKQFQFTFLIRHPRRAIPSYYRCTVPPLDEVTGFYHFMPNEAGYEELVTLFDFLLKSGIVDKEQLVIVDADDLLDNPEKTIRLYCEKTGIDFKPEMLDWNDNDSTHARDAFEKWNGFHNDAIKSSSLKPRTHAQTSTTESENKDWTAKWGPEAQKIIRQTVDDNVARYEYLKQYALEI